MATQFCQKCKQSHVGRTCDYDNEGECAETADSEERIEDRTANASTRGETSGGSQDRS